MLATIVEQVHQLWRFTAPVQGEDGKQTHLVLSQPAAPLHINRPGVIPQKQNVKPLRRNDHAAIARFFRGG